MTELKIIHKNMNLKECYKLYKKYYKEDPDVFMNPDVWLKEIKEDDRIQ